MQYWQVTWHHEFSDEPETLWSEIGSDGYEVRKIQKFKDGRVVKADSEHETREVGLSEVPVGTLDEVAAQPEFSAFYISLEEFENLWSQAAWSTPRAPDS